jgi:phosphonate transport system substrate-binding protein
MNKETTMVSTKRHTQPGFLLSGTLIFVLLIMILAACGNQAATTTTGNNTTANNKPKISLSELRIGFIPAENATKVIDETQPFIKAMEKELGIPVKLSVSPNYTGTIEALSSGKIDVAWFGPFSYVLAANKYNAEAFALQLLPDGSDHYYSYIITTPKTGIKTLSDLKGRTFTFVDPASTSGNLIPRYTLLKNGLDPDKDVKATFAGGHDASLLAVASGKADAGAVASDIYAKLLSQGKFKEGELTIVAKSDPIPNSPIAYRKELSQGDKDIIKQVFINMKDSAALKAVNASAFKATSDSTYDGLRDVAKTLNLDLSKLK